MSTHGSLPGGAAIALESAASEAARMAYDMLKVCDLPEQGG